MAFADELRHYLCDVQNHPSDERPHDLLHLAATERALVCSGLRRALRAHHVSTRHEHTSNGGIETDLTSERLRSRPFVRRLFLVPLLFCDLAAGKSSECFHRLSRRFQGGGPVAILPLTLPSLFEEQPLVPPHTKYSSMLSAKKTCKALETKSARAIAQHPSAIPAI